MAVADELARTALEQRALAEVRDASGVVDGPMERHGVRCFLLIEPLAQTRVVEIDRKVALCAALVHDLGIYPSVSAGGVYVDESAELATRLFAEAEPQRGRVCADACRYHHALADQSSRGIEVELLRLADQIEVGGGVRRCGLSRAEIRRIGEVVPRDGFYREIGRLLVRALRDRPATLPKIFKR